MLSGAWLATPRVLGGFIIYVDPATVLRQGDLVKMLVLDDFRFVQAIKGTSYLSATWQQQFDCAEHQSTAGQRGMGVVPEVYARDIDLEKLEKDARAAKKGLRGEASRLTG